MNNTAHNGFKKGDRVRATKTGKEYTFVEYQDTFTAKLENDRLEVFSYNLDEIEVVVPVSKTPRTDKVFADIGENILDHAYELETELDAAKGIAEALEEEVRQLKDQLTNSQKLAKARAEAFNKVRQDRDNWEETAAQHLHNEQYYRELLVSCGQAIGKEAYTCDYGTTQTNVLVAKVPELVRRLVEEHGNWEHLAVENAKLLQVYFDECSQQPPHVDHTEGGRYEMLTPGVSIIEWGDEVSWEDNPWLPYQSMAVGKVVQSVMKARRRIPQEDFAQQAKELLQNIHGFNDTVTSNAIDNFVDLIIKAAKQ